MLVLTNNSSRRSVFSLPRLYVFGKSERDLDKADSTRDLRKAGDDDGTGRDGDTKSCSTETEEIEGYMESEFTVAIDLDAIQIDRRSYVDEKFVSQCGELPSEYLLKPRNDDTEDDRDGYDTEDNEDVDELEEKRGPLKVIEETDNESVDALSISASIKSATNKHLKPTVWFAMDLDTGKVMSKMYSDYLPIHKSEHRKVWYRQRDYERFRRENKRITNAARQTSYVADFARVYHSTISSKRLRSLTKKQTVAVADSPNRGFEAAIFLDTLGTDRRACVSQIVEMQDHFLTLGDYLSAEEREQKLAVLSRSLTKQTRRLAFVLGSGDALVAQSMITPAEQKFLMQWTKFFTVHDDEQSIHMCSI
jgi:hypothetical protein